MDFHAHHNCPSYHRSRARVVSIPCLKSTTIPFAMLTIILKRYIFAKFQISLEPGLQTVPFERTIPTYLTLFIFGFLYQLVLVYDSLRLKNTIQVIGLCLYNLGMLIYAAIQYDQIDKAIATLKTDNYIEEDNPLWAIIRPYLLASPCIIAFFSLIMGFVAWKLYDEFAWTIYKHISADLRMKRRFLAFQVSSSSRGSAISVLTNLDLYRFAEV
jgi:hypothetical protein